MKHESIKESDGTKVFQKVTRLLPNLFKKIIEKNKISSKRKSSLFDCTYQISIGFEEYFTRLVDLMDPECNTLIYSLILIDSLCDKDKIILSSKNIHKVFFMSLLISIKLLEDEIYNENHYSVSAGISQKEIASLENEFLNQISYSILIPTSKFDLYLKSFL